MSDMYIELADSRDAINDSYSSWIEKNKESLLEDYNNEFEINLDDVSLIDNDWLSAKCDTLESQNYGWDDE